MNQPLYIRLPNGEFQMVSPTPQPPHAMHQASVQYLKNIFILFHFKILCTFFFVIVFPLIANRESKKAKDKLKNISLATLITYILGFFTFIPHIISAILSLRIISRNRKNITNTKARIGNFFLYYFGPLAINHSFANHFIFSYCFSSY